MKKRKNEARPNLLVLLQKERAFQTRVLFCGEVFATNHLLLFLKYENKNGVHHEISDYFVRRI